jgi:type II restriction enzyme
VKPTPRQIAAGIVDTGTAFAHLTSTFRESLKLWDYFVNWDKVFKNTRDLEIALNLWNVLLGKEDFDSDFLDLLERHPEIVKAIPSLIVRDGAKSTTYSIIQDIGDLKVPEHLYDFSKPADTQVLRESALDFVKRTGLIRIFQRGAVKNLVDYVLGVEAGLDSNGRKNRSGKSMEAVVAKYLEGLCNRTGLQFIPQASPKEIQDRFGFIVPVDKSSRIFDFAISDGKHLVLMEVNFYGGGGSKLKATAGEYIGLHNFLKAGDRDFVWITDGRGWLTTLIPLRAAFEKIDYVWNLNVLSDDLLLDIFHR